MAGSNGKKPPQGDSKAKLPEAVQVALINAASSVVGGNSTSALYAVASKYLGSLFALETTIPPAPAAEAKDGQAA